MKKRILALLLAMLFVFSTVVLSACGEESDPSEGLDEGNRADPITLTLCIVADSYTEEARLAIQSELNLITQEQYNTNVVLYIATHDQYRKILADHLAAAKDGTNKSPNLDAQGNEIVAEGYAGLTGTQFDVVWIDGYDHFLELAASGALKKLNLGERKELNQYIDPLALTLAGRYEGATESGTYAVPVRHIFGDYTYLLLNKDVVKNENINFDYKNVTSLSALEPYITQVMALQEEGKLSKDMTVLQNLPEAQYLRPVQAIKKVDKQIENVVLPNVLLGSNVCFPTIDENGIPHSTLSQKNSAIGSLLLNEQYQDEVIYRALYGNGDGQLGILKEGAVTDANCAAAFVKGDASLKEMYENMGYYVVEYAQPVATRAELSRSMFGITANTINELRSLELICALTTNADVCNLLAYGVEDQHYKLITEDDEKVVEFITKGNADYKETNLYKNDGLYCGNQFLTLPNKEMTPSQRILAKDQWYVAAGQDLAMTINPFDFFSPDISKTSSKMTIEGILPEVEQLVGTVLQNIDGFTKYKNFQVYTGVWITDPDDPNSLIPADPDDPKKWREGTEAEYVAAFRKFLSEDQQEILMANSMFKKLAGLDSAKPNVSLSFWGQYNAWYTKIKLNELLKVTE